MTKVIFYGIHCNLELQIFSRLQLTLTADLAETRESTLVLKSRALANRNVAFRCLLVSLDHKADLLIFIDEKNCSQTYVQPNITIGLFRKLQRLILDTFF